MPADLPSDFPTQDDYAVYYAGYAEAACTCTEQVEMDSHEAMLALVPRDEYTKIYAADTGDWSTAANWYPNGVPGVDAKVVIGEGVEVTYDVDDDTTSLEWLRVDGTLTFARDQDTSMLIDTIVTTEGSMWDQGTVASPIPLPYTSRIIFADNGPIDVSWDTFFLSRGAVWAGSVRIHGEEKTSFIHSTTSGAALGATSIVLSASPTGWEIGDHIVIGGSRYFGTSWDNTVGSLEYFGRRCEEVTITNVAGATITFTPALAYDHIPPSHSHPTAQLRLHVINLTRNIQFVPEVDFDMGLGAAISTVASPNHYSSYLPMMAKGDLRGNERPHTMFMHNPDVDVRFAEFARIGRTHKHFPPTVISRKKTIAAGATLVPDGAWSEGGVVECDTLFQPYARWSSGGSTTLTFSGTDAFGNPQTEVRTGTSPYGCKKLFKTFTGVQSSNAIGGFYCGFRLRSFLMTGDGVKNWNDSGNTANITYDVLTNKHNIQGRYPVHIHKTDLDAYATPVYLKGLSVHESPGWGYAHHASHAVIEECVAYDCSTAGFVGEAGNETGLWKNLCAIGMRYGNGDISHKGGAGGISDAEVKDPATSGTPFWFTGRVIKVLNFYASDGEASSVYNVRLQQVQLQSWQYDQPELLRGYAVSNVDDHPLAHVQNHECIGCWRSLLVIKANQAQGHDFRTHLDGVLTWSTREGPEITYTTHYTNDNFVTIKGYLDSYNTATKKFGGGLGFGPNASDQLMVDSYAENMLDGMKLYHNHVGDVDWDSDPIGRQVVDPVFVNCTNEYIDLRANDHIYDSSTFDPPFTTLVLDVARPTMATTTPFLTPITGTKTDQVREYDFPFGEDTFQYTTSNLYNIALQYGTWTHTDTFRYLLTREYYSNSLTAEPEMMIVPIKVANAGGLFVLANVANNGSCDLDDNTPPTVADFAVETTIYTPLTVDVVGDHATHPDAATMYLAGFTSTFNSTFKNNGNGTITIYPIPGYEGVETFFVWVGDKNGNVTKATVTLTVDGVAAPDFIANADTGFTAFETAVHLDVLANDTGTGLTLTDVTVTGGAGVGTATIMNQELMFTPATDFSGLATGTYEVTDGALDTLEGAWTINVAEEVVVVDPPVTEDFTVKCIRNYVQFNVLDRCSDPQDLTLLLISCTTPAPVEIDIQIDGTIMVTPNPTYSGTTILTYTVSNGIESTQGLVTLVVKPRTGWGQRKS
jgi:hypothetical protein